ncbi:MAG: RNA polymerase sigma factor [Minicystis sp.]
MTTGEDRGDRSAPVLTPAFTALFEEHFDYVCRSLQRLGVREADAEDVAQELFLAVHRALPESDPGRPMKPWLFGFAMRYASNYRRLGWHRGRALDDTPVSPRSTTGSRPSARSSARSTSSTSTSAPSW